MYSGTSRGLLDRMRGAALLDTRTYEDVEADQGATTQALLAVVIVAVLAGIGLALGGHPAAFLAGIVSSIIGWIVWSYVTYWVGTGLLGGTATPGEMLRTLGFAQAPRALELLSFIPILGGIIRLIVYIWLLVTGIVAIRQALDFDTGRAIATAVIGWIAMVIITIIMAIVTGAFAGLGAAFH